MMRKKLLFACTGNYLDPSNGASIASREMLVALTERGWDVHTFCGHQLDIQRNLELSQLLSDRGITDVTEIHCQGVENYSLYHFMDGAIRSTHFLPENRTTPYPKQLACLFLSLMQKTIRSIEPEVVVTYGGREFGYAMLTLSRLEGAKVVTTIHNCAYSNKEYFDGSNLIVVPSEFSVKFYADRVGIQSKAIPPFLNRSASTWSENRHLREFVTFINPDTNKGICWMIRVLKVMNEMRPDIKFLFVEGRAGTGFLKQIGHLLKNIDNLYWMQNTTNPKDYYERSKIVIVPSFWNETFGRVPVEAMLNGIPVIASDRGSLPEVVGNDGILLNIPAQYTPETMTIPTNQEVMPWVNAIIKLWDDRRFYEQLSNQGRLRAKRWEYDVVADSYDQAFSNLIH